MLALLRLDEHRDYRRAPEQIIATAENLPNYGVSNGLKSLYMEL